MLQSTNKNFVDSLEQNKTFFTSYLKVLRTH